MEREKPWCGTKFKRKLMLRELNAGALCSAHHIGLITANCWKVLALAIMESDRCAFIKKNARSPQTTGAMEDERSSEGGYWLGDAAQVRSLCPRHDCHSSENVGVAGQEFPESIAPWTGVDGSAPGSMRDSKGRRFLGHGGAVALPGQGHSERRRNVHEQWQGSSGWWYWRGRHWQEVSGARPKMAQGLRLVALSQVGQLQLGLASWFTSGWRCEEPCRGVSRVPSARVELPRHGERDSAEVRWMLGEAQR